MNAPDKCPRCGQPTPHSFTQCIVDQRDALAARVKELEAKREVLAVRNLSNMLHVEGLNRKIARLIEAGDAFAETAEPTAWDNWVKAKEVKP